MDCIYNIPVCGGFCAPTKNPEPSCVRHFSNEYTLPGAGVFMKCAPVLETNRCCRTCARSGTKWGKANRRPVMLCAFGVSCIGWFLTIYGACAVSMNPAILKKAAWVHGKMVHAQTNTSLAVAVGLRGRVDTIDCSLADLAPGTCASAVNGTNFQQIDDEGFIFERVIRWSDDRSCWSPPMREDVNSVALETWDFLKKDTFTDDVCSGCRNTAMASVTFAIMGVITQIPQITTDLQRSTLFGDVNCQATMGTVTSFFGTYSTLASLGTFSQSCWSNFPTSPPWNPKETPMYWRPGNAFICLVIATILKLWDAFSHLLVPTPRARHKRPRKELDLTAYMSMAVEGDMAEEEDADSDGSADELE